MLRVGWCAFGVAVPLSIDLTLIEQGGISSFTGLSVRGHARVHLERRVQA
jgi:hypothetical protein